MLHHRIVRRCHNQNKPARRRCRLRVEVLEDRSVPSALQGVQVIHTLGNPNPAPVPGYQINDFEPDGLNKNGDIIYGNDLGTANDPSTFYGEGIFLQKSGGQPTPLAYATSPAPGTGRTYGYGFAGPASLNNNDDAAFVFLLNPVGTPFGAGAGAFRYSAATQTVSPIIVPGATKVPGGSDTFVGADGLAAINNSSDVVFPGMIPTNKGIPGSVTDSGVKVGDGVYESYASGKLVKLVAPGDKAPGGGTFDYADGPTVNDHGNVAFNGHLSGEPYQLPIFPPPSQNIFPYKSVYVRNGTTGAITSIAHIGDAAPGGGTFSQCLFPDINSNGDVLFTGDLSPMSNPNQSLGVFLYQAATGKTISIARPGDPMPGGGNVVSTSVVGSIYDLNNSGSVIFSCILNTDVLHTGTLDTGQFEWSNGQVSLIARTGTEIPGVGKVQGIYATGAIIIPPPTVITPFGGVINDKGQILFNVTFTDGSDRLLLYTPPSTSTSAATPFVVVASSSSSGGTAAAVAGSTSSSSGQAGATSAASIPVSAPSALSTALRQVAPNKVASGALDAFFASFNNDPLASGL
jgi:hypothetical protein